jgi:hypothetical protein
MAEAQGYGDFSNYWKTEVRPFRNLAKLHTWFEELEK